jgi:CBS domain-containing protein
MKVRDVLKVKGSQVYSIRPDQTILEAVALLMQHGIGALLVLDHAGMVSGIVSERDVLRECLHRSADLGRIPIREVMTKDLVVCVPDDEVDYAMGIVTNNRVRHLPIMDGERVAGIISIGDLVKAGLEEAEYENRYLKEYIQAR